MQITLYSNAVTNSEMPPAEGFPDYVYTARHETDTPPAPHGEMWAQSDAEYRFAELCTPPVAVVYAQKKALLQVIDKALTTAINNHERNAIITAACILEWQMFDPGGPVPQGVVLTSSKIDGGFISTDTRKPFTSDCSAASQHRLRAAGLDVVTDAIKQSLKSRRAEMCATLAAAIVETPEHTLIQSFTTQLPTAAEERPLPPSLRDEREQKIRREGRAGLHDWEPLQTAPNARKAVRRGIQLLEEETVRQPHIQAEGNAIARARSYFFPYLFRAAQAEFGATITGFKRGTANLILEGEGVSSAEHTDEASTVIFRAVEEIMGTFKVDTSVAMHTLREGMLYDFIWQIVDPENTTSVQEIAANAADNAVVQAVDLVINHTGILNYDRDKELQSQLRHTPVAEYINHDTLHAEEVRRHRLCSMRDSTQMSGFTTRSDYEYRKSVVIGRLSPESVDRLEGRIIMVQPATAGVPAFTPGEDVVLQINEHAGYYMGKHIELFIPGYTLVSSSGTRFGFVRDTHDPYVAAEVPLDEETQQRAAELAMRLQMPGLATAIAAQTDLTVEGLRSLLVSYCDYRLPEDRYAAARDGLPGDMAADTLEDYVRLVADGRMAQQCTISADVKCAILNELFGAGSAVTISGYTVDARGQITTAGHRQTVFTSPDGRMYVLDATPPSEDSTMPVPSPSSEPRVTQGAPIQPRLKDLPTLPPQHIEKPGDDEKKQHRLNMTLDRLEARLQVLFRCRYPQALADHVITLPQDDPVRRTLEVVRMAVNGTVAPDEVRNLLRYLRAVRDADESLLRQLHITDYDPWLLDILQEGAQRIQQYVFGEGNGTPNIDGVNPVAHGEHGCAANIETIERSVRAALERLPQDELALATEAVNRALHTIRAALGDVPQAVAAAVIMSSMSTAHDDVGNVLARLQEGARLVEEYRQFIL